MDLQKSEEGESVSSTGVRLDKWLWTVRVYKTRALAMAACKAGCVQIAGIEAKPSREPRVGEVLVVKQGVVHRTLCVRGAPKGRVAAKQVPVYCEERTPPEEFEKAREQRVQHLLEREKGMGRPTKRDRREIDRFKENL